MALDWYSIISFFVLDSLKILVLLFVMVFVLGVLRSFISQRRLRKLARGRYGSGNVVASLFGVVTPFCSCSSIPIFWSFIRSGVPLGTSLSFLITSPLVNEYVVILMLASFGFKVTLAYIISGVVIGVLAGMFLGSRKLEKHIVADMRTVLKEEKFSSFKGRVRFGFREAIEVTRKLWLWILAGVGLGAVIHNTVPEAFFTGVVSSGSWWTVPVAILLGVPLYGSAAALVPVAQELFAKGIPLGTTLAFVMSIAGLSLPEAIILRRAMKLKLIGIFFGVVALGILLTGWLFNWLW